MLNTVAVKPFEDQWSRVFARVVYAMRLIQSRAPVTGLAVLARPQPGKNDISLILSAGLP
jgi:hypothetical protein